MKRTSKKLISACLALLLVVSLVPATSASAYNNDDTLFVVKNEDGTYHVSNPTSRAVAESVILHADESHQIYYSDSDAAYMKVDENRLIEATEITIDAKNKRALFELAEDLEISDALIADVNRLMDNAANGDFELNELRIFVPANRSNSQEITKYDTRTFTGYKGQTYYQEILLYRGISGERDAKNLPAGWKQYLAKLFKAGAREAVNGVMSATKFGPAWTLLSVFGQSVDNVVYTQSTAKHTVKLCENKLIKYTYYVSGIDKRLGSVIEFTTDYHFTNLLNIPGQGVEVEGNTPGKQFGNLDIFDNGDEYAYYYYLSNPYQYTVSRYEFECVEDEENVHLTFSSLYHG